MTRDEAPRIAIATKIAKLPPNGEGDKLGFACFSNGSRRSVLSRFMKQNHQAVSAFGERAAEAEVQKIICCIRNGFPTFDRSFLIILATRRTIARRGRAP